MMRLPAASKAALAIALIVALPGVPVAASERPRVHTNERYIEDVTRRTSLPLDDPKAMFAFILESLPDRVKVYPTENYYYFHFYHNGVRYGGNIRLDAADRDRGKVHFAYHAALAEWQPRDDLRYRVFGSEDGVAVERMAPLLYRVSLGGRSVEFALNDLSGVAPPGDALGPNDRYLGPVFDESGIRFFLVFNGRLKLFHYVLDETEGVADELVPSALAQRILIGRRTGFAFYDEHRLKRKILIGVFEANAGANNHLDGPFDQLPDNFVRGDELRRAILEVEPGLKGRIDRFGGSPDGASRYLIAPYAYYRAEEDLLPIHECATSREIPRELYYACFAVSNDEDADGGGNAATPAPPAPPPRPGPAAVPKK